MTTDAIRQAMLKFSSKCLRCGGLLLPETIYSSGDKCKVLHCIMCGTSYDPVIMEHKMHGPKKETYEKRKGWYYSSVD
jgi:transcription elongation factor Elf1